MTLPLADVRIIAVEQYGAGPWGTLQLADLGAEVIKIEDPASNGDVGRYVPPYEEGEDSLFFETFNRNKKSVSLNLRSPRGREVFEALVAKSDAVYSNLRGDQPHKLRITYDDLRDVNPRIVCCSLSGFGMTGPRAAQPGYDYVMQAMAGWMSLTGDPDGPPTKSGLSLVDLSGGYVSAIALLSGLWRARRDGVGCDCDISLYETALHELIYIGTWAASAGYVPQRIAESAHPSIVPFQAFQTADGWITVACAKQKFWELLCGALGPRGPARGPPVRRLRRASTATATRCSRSCARPSGRGRPLSGRRSCRGRACPMAPCTRSPRRSRTSRRMRARTSSRSSTPSSGPCARSPRRCGCQGEPNPARPRPVPRRAHRRAAARSVRLFRRRDRRAAGGRRVRRRRRGPGSIAGRVAWRQGWT